MRKIAISSTHGGFSLSDTALTILGIPLPYRCQQSDLEVDCEEDLKRDDPRLIALFESMGPEAFGAEGTDLVIVEIPDDVKWLIKQYDCAEWIAEVHRTWRAEEVPCK